MNRQLKFREWLGKAFHYWGFMEDGSFILPTNIKGPQQQMTGLLDKNGKEIWEGDIIQYKSYHVNERWWSSTNEIPVIEEECKKQRENFEIVNYQVKFIDGEFVLGYSVKFSDVARGERFKTGRSYHCDTEEKQWDFEVIGNIYENPDLLK